VTRIRSLRSRPPQRPAKPVRLESADADDITEGDQIKLVEIRSHGKDGTGSVGRHPSYPSDEIWDRVRPSRAHSCEECRRLCLEFGRIGSTVEGQSAVFTYKELEDAATKQCLVFRWLRELLYAENVELVDERIFSLSFVSRRAALESNDASEFDFQDHGSLDACFEKGRVACGFPLASRG
jgi:hypothetical protein